MKSLTLLCLISAALLFVGCGTTDNTNSGNTNSGSTSASPAATKPADTKPGDTGGPMTIGVASCDEYLTRVDKCVNSPNMPEAAKAAYRSSLDQNRAAWRQAAATPQGKAGLEASCKAALDSAKAFLDTCK
jgi:hypothetical protein